MIKFLVFEIDENLFAINLVDVREVVFLANITKIVGFSPSILGITHFYGEIITIIDTAYRLGIRDKKISKKQCAIMVDIGDETVGLAVDNAIKVIDVDDSEIISISKESNPLQNRYSLGVIEHDLEFVVLLDKKISKGQ